MILRNKRAGLAAAFQATGLLRLLERWALRPGVVVLAYHRIGQPEADPFYAPLISATPEAFRAQLEAIARAYRVLSLDDLLAAIDHRDQLHVERPSVLLTFDDGYRDNLDLAAPILSRLGLPATLFATTGFLNHERLPWWDRVAYALQTTRLPTITVDRPASRTFDLRHGREPAITALINDFIAAGWEADDADLAHLEARCQVTVNPTQLASQLFLAPADLPALRAFGFSLAAHTHTHRRLATLDQAAQRAELASRPPDALPALAYPFGGPDSFNTTTLRLAREAGYQIAFALRGGAIRPGPVDRFACPRLAVTSADTLPLLRARLALTAARPA
ncbi:MAG: polysaccharide deacetylase [Isosphaeraceae bacterium]|jgi:peptidoglycan/xylan/chitin deacetylase (PgdA/CDA1 family)|nr:MAG: polysaccharide deacetylase [Isosphaeraceae bacterium]